MTRRPRDAHHPARPTPTIEEAAYLEIQRTAQATVRWVVESLKPLGLTPPQFNVLRILRGALPEALPGCRIAERMVAFDPDLTRLLDRLEAAGWVAKERDAADRRVVNVRITRAGVQVVEQASLAVRDRITEEMQHVGRRDLATLGGLLEQVRTRPDTAGPSQRP
jgi:DNA-binding MarR family transcriptional regulator